MLPERSIDSKYTKAVFFEQDNDIDIYIEDTATGYKKLFIKLFQRVFEGIYKIDNIFPLGPRNKVINHCKDNSVVTRPTLYIVDGDIFLLNGEPKKIPNGVFVLPKYCVENILIDEEAFCKFMDDESVEQDVNTLKQNLNFSVWVEDNKKLLVPLFVEYAVALRVSAQIKTISYGVNKLVIGEGDCVDANLVLDRMKEIKESILERIDEGSYDTFKKEIIERLEKEECHLLKYVSGKDYLMPLLMRKVRTLIDSAPSNINIKQRIANHCDVTCLSPSRQVVLV